ncbi:shikimate dehydrogenase [bacterium]|nr:shikimate dehydrogenase [bacterium]MBU1936255.1 shikimate dehydrogenase [bacterium]
MLKLGILGQNISYSLSPFIHKEAMRILDISGDYEIFDCDETQVESFFSRFVDSGLRGLNITTPYKEIALKYCTEVSDAAERTGAVNTLSFVNETIRGDNTDVYGFEKALEEFAGNQALPCTIVLGNGGAARAVLTVLSSLPSVNEIIVVARRQESARKQLASFVSGNNYNVYSFSDPRLVTTIARASLIVNCTTVGSAANPGMALPWSEHLSARTKVMDLIYAPAKTEFLAAAEAAGCAKQNGIDMLLHQAAASFNLWTKKSFPLREVRAALQKEVVSS